MENDDFGNDDFTNARVTEVALPALPYCQGNTVELQWLEHLWDNETCSRQGSSS